MNMEEFIMLMAVAMLMTGGMTGLVSFFVAGIILVIVSLTIKYWWKP